MKKDERKAVYGIRAKLVSAVAMLLVACIMVVSSTYAWFTLSTAPEVSGISTSVGANGALEMMLTKWTGSDFADGSTAQSNGDTNATWGNLVNLKDGTVVYGSQMITLYPSQLKLNALNQFDKNQYLHFPKYGADGRPETGLTGETIVGTYQEGAFYRDEASYGFRVIGSASGMTARQLAYRNALSAVTVNMNLAVNAAKESLDGRVSAERKSNGTILADIAMMKGMQEEPRFTSDQLEAIQRMITQLNVSADYLEKAYVQALLAFAASFESGMTDTDFDAIKATVTDATTFADLRDAVVEKLANEDKLALIDYAYAKLTAAKTQIGTAQDEADKLSGGNTFTWEEIEKPLAPLVNVTLVTVNNRTITEVKNNPNSLIQDYGSGKGITVSMPTGSGVYADIADQCGDYFTSIVLDTSTMGISFGGGVEVSATMATKTSVNPVYVQGVLEGTQYADLNGTAIAISGKSPSGEGANKPLTEFYGYIVDLTFRTNAAQANLLLSGPQDRIYDDNNNDATMGHGSTMTFKSSDSNFGENQVKSLMKNICIVFFSTDAVSGAQEILAYAKLDVANAQMTVDGVKANMYVYEKVDNAYEYTPDDGEKTIVYKSEDKYYSDKDLKTEVAITDATKLNPVKEVKVENNKITSLNQNVAKRISALVYLDGTTITNADVAASAAQSMTGSVNFQFATDATLTPMEYADLHTPNGTPSTDSNN